MNRLFLRLFFSFWLAFGVLAAGFALLFLLDDPPWHRDRFSTLAALALRSHAAHRHAAHQGDPRAAAEVAHFLHRTGLRTWLVCTGVPPIGDGTPPPDLVALAARADASGGPQRTRGESLDRYAEPLTEGPAAGCVVAAEFPHPSRLERYLDADTALLRLLLALAVAGAFAGLLARSITRPLGRLRLAAGRLAAGDLHARVAPDLARRRDEIAALGREFDRMAERLGALVDRERRLLGDVSHELRSPLARIQVALQLARARSGPEAAGSLDQIERDAERLNELIGQVLTVARLESDPSALPAEPLALDDLVRRVCDDARFEAEGSGRRVELAPPPEVRVRGNPEVFRRAVENVLRNAVRFTPEGTVVEVELSRDQTPDGPRARLRIRDHGPGVPPDALEEIFLPFRRLDDARGRDRGGVGLGLAITERAVRAHHGTVRAANRPDGGLEITLEIPAVDR